jgi:hypothetical protein
MKALKKRARRGHAGGEGLFVHLWACGERRKGGDARARRARGKRPRRVSKDRSFACDWVRTVGPGRVEKTINVRTMFGFLFLGQFLGLCAAGRNMTKTSIREFKLAGRGGMGCILVSTSAGPFVGDGVALLTKDCVPLPRRKLETVLSAGYKIAVDLGSRLAKASNQGDHALASIVLTQLQLPALPDKGAGVRMNKAAAMLEQGASAAEVLKLLCPTANWRSSTPIISPWRRTIHHGGDGHGEFRGHGAGGDPGASAFLAVDGGAGTIPSGTAIATFEDGRYGNAPHGNHAAIFISQ